VLGHGLLRIAGRTRWSSKNTQSHTHIHTYTHTHTSIKNTHTHTHTHTQSSTSLSSRNREHLGESNTRIKHVKKRNKQKNRALTNSNKFIYVFILKQ
jgi:hypothetical protein